MDNSDWRLGPPLYTTIAAMSTSRDGSRELESIVRI
jgi:hypothetical protein